MHLTHRKTCRVCGSAALTRVIDLGEQHLQGSFVKPGKEDPPRRRIPLQLLRCDPTRDEHACGLLQLAHTTPAEILYSAYWYRSGTNQTMRSHLAEIATEAATLLGQPKARVLDIGCNDGTLLKAYPGGYLKFGVDPSDIARQLMQDAAMGGELKVVQDLFPSDQLTALADGKPFDIVTAIAMLYDLEHPIDFVQNVKRCLAPDGLWVFEMSYMPTMLAMNSYDTICHEHLEYYSLAVLEFMLREAGMKIFRARLNAINGGSIRCYATHQENSRYECHEFTQTLTRLRQEEFDLELDTDKPYRNFQERIEAHRSELQSLLKRWRRDGKRIHVYGASTKGNTILQWCGIDNTLIDYAADRNPDKYGARTLGTDIPIISEAESRAMHPDYYLVLPWHFKDEFLAREREALDRGVGMVFPLPSIEVITRKP
jgi:SAM-dependent methyltransferase